MSACLCTHSPHNEIISFIGVERTNTESNARLFDNANVYMTKKNSKVENIKWQTCEEHSPHYKGKFYSVLSIKYLARHNEKILQITKNGQRKISLNKFLLLICTKKSRE